MGKQSTPVIFIIRESVLLLVDVPGLWMVETLDSVKTADTLNRHWALRDRGHDPLRVLVQINTSNEESKSTDRISLTLHVRYCFCLILNPNCAV